MSKTGIGLRRKLLGGDGGCSGLGLDHKIIMLICVVALSDFFKLSNIVPFVSRVIGAWAWVINGGWVLKNR